MVGGQGRQRVAALRSTQMGQAHERLRIADDPVCAELSGRGPSRTAFCSWSVGAFIDSSLVPHET